MLQTEILARIVMAENTTQSLQGCMASIERLREHKDILPRTNYFLNRLSEQRYILRRSISSGKSITKEIGLIFLRFIT
jgi:hypothetical protein